MMYASERQLPRSLRIAAALLAASTLLACEPPESTERSRAGTLSLTEAMSPGATEGFLRADAPIEIELPRDHGPHPGFQTEWWYVVDNLEANERRFGYQITFFRSALRPPRESAGGSSWSTDDVFMAHFALTDIDRHEFRSFERFSRGALGLAGVHVEPFAVWLEDWRLDADHSSTFPLRLRAAQDGVEIDLRLTTAKPVVLQGERGFSQKGAQPGNASYYYSLTRLPTRGTIRLDQREFEVEGDSWMDREWSTSALEPGQVGWDWFALQLSDGRDLMVYRMRLEGERTDPHSSGVIVEPDGSYRGLDATDFEIEVTDRWRSRQTGADYPARWRVVSRAAGVDLVVEPQLASQEHTGSVIYWEGAVRVEGTSRDLPVTGRGYVELTGYGEAVSVSDGVSDPVSGAR
jgi:predicted secreted hydrolase